MTACKLLLLPGMATWELVRRWISSTLGAHAEGSALSVVVGGRLVLVFPSDPADDDGAEEVRLVAPIASAARCGDRELAARLLAEGALAEHHGRYYLQAPVAIGRTNPTAIVGALRGFGDTAAGLCARLAPRPVAGWCAGYAD